MTHVKAVARLLIVQGIGEFVAAVLFFGGVRTLPGQSDQGAAVFMMVLAVVVLICAILKMFAGARNWKMRSRGLGYVGLLSALPTALTCWCAPTGVAIMVYGLIVYSRPEVRAAFDRAEANPSGPTLDLR